MRDSRSKMPQLVLEGKEELKPTTKHKLNNPSSTVEASVKRLRASGPEEEKESQTVEQTFKQRLEGLILEKSRIEKNLANTESELNDLYERGPRPDDPKIKHKAPDLYCAISTRLARNPAKLPCDHIFEKSEIKHWAQSKRTCPCCRAPFTSQDLKLDKSCKKEADNLFGPLENKIERLTSALEKVKEKILVLRCFFGQMSLEERGQYLNKCMEGAEEGEESSPKLEILTLITQLNALHPDESTLGDEKKQLALLIQHALHWYLEGEITHARACAYNRVCKPIITLYEPHRAPLSQRQKVLGNVVNELDLLFGDSSIQILRGSNEEGSDGVYINFFSGVEDFLSKRSGAPWASPSLNIAHLEWNLVVEKAHTSESDEHFVKIGLKNTSAQSNLEFIADCAIAFSDNPDDRKMDQLLLTDAVFKAGTTVPQSFSIGDYQGVCLGIHITNVRNTILFHPHASDDESAAPEAKLSAGTAIPAIVLDPSTNALAALPAPQGLVRPRIPGHRAQQEALIDEDKLSDLLYLRKKIPGIPMPASLVVLAFIRGLYQLSYPGIGGRNIEDPLMIQLDPELERLTKHAFAMTDYEKMDTLRFIMDNGFPSVGMFDNYLNWLFAPVQMSGAGWDLTPPLNSPLELVPDDYRNSFKIQPTPKDPERDPILGVFFSPVHDRWNHKHAKERLNLQGDFRPNLLTYMLYNVPFNHSWLVIRFLDRIGSKAAWSNFEIFNDTARSYGARDSRNSYDVKKSVRHRSRKMLRKSQVTHLATAPPEHVASRLTAPYSFEASLSAGRGEGRGVEAESVDAASSSALAGRSAPQLRFFPYIKLETLSASISSSDEMTLRGGAGFQTLIPAEQLPRLDQQHPLGFDNIGGSSSSSSGSSSSQSLPATEADYLLDDDARPDQSRPSLS